MYRMDLSELIKQTLSAVKENSNGNSVDIEFDLFVGADEHEKTLKVYSAAGDSTEVSRVKFILET